MKGLRARKRWLVVMQLLSLLLLLLLLIVQTESHSVGEQQRGIVGIGYPAFFYDIKHQFGSIGRDLRQLVTSLLGATQVVYWKHPLKRPNALRRADVVAVQHQQQQQQQQQPVRRQPHRKATQQRTGRRKKKAYDGGDYDDFFSFDALGLW
uniref:Uncharacterized protein n=1 Tax=Anopheles albimanus TaxID=7167 RepID=A0A182FGI9_ANOAL